MVLALKNAFHRWFGGRMPRGKAVRLNPRSTYILPTRLGFLVVGVVLLMLIGATNYQNNLAFLLTFLLTGLGLVTIIFTVRNLQDIEFTLNKPAEVFVGQSIPLTLSLRSLNGQKHFSIGIGFDKEPVMLTDLDVEGFSQIAIDFQARERGWLSLPRMTATSQFPFGWLRAWGYFSIDLSILVYPRPLEPAMLDSHASGQPSDEGFKTGGSDDLYGLRSYQPGEALSRVDWKAYARERGLFVREFVQYQSAQLCFSWHDFPGIADETRLSYLTFQVLQAAAQNLDYSLQLPNELIVFGSGESQRSRCLTALALYGKSGVNEAAPS